MQAGVRATGVRFALSLSERYGIAGLVKTRILVRLAVIGMAMAVCNCSAPHRSVSAISASASALSQSTRARLEKSGIHGCDHVVAYAYNLGSSYPAGGRFIVTRGRLNATRTPVTGVRLSDPQVNRLAGAAAASVRPSVFANCFNPRHGFVFYRADGSIAASYSVCLECQGVDEKGCEFGSRPDYSALGGLIDQLGLPVR